MRTSIDDYATEPMVALWSPKARIILERELWVLIMKMQRAEGVSIPEEAIAAYDEIAEILPDNTLEQIEIIEKATKHDLRARLTFFNKQAGYNYAHWGLTSCDITENAMQLQIRESLGLLAGSVRHVMALLAEHIKATRYVVVAARTHNQVAQPTLLGKRFASIADELSLAYGSLRLVHQTMPLRGLVGAVGTGQDLVELTGSVEAVKRMNAAMLSSLQFPCDFFSVGQVYPRSADLEWSSALNQLAAPCSNLARMVRLESSYPHMWESFDDGGQVGSSAMPHKRNPIRSERIGGLAEVVRGFTTMVDAGSGAQWYEGDVSDSVTRRIAVPGALKAVDAILNETARLLQDLDLSKDMYEAEAEEYGASIRTGDVLTAALLAGADRDEAYRAIQQERIPPGLTDQQVVEILQRPIELPLVQDQIDGTLKLIEEVISGAIG